MGKKNKVPLRMQNILNLNFSHMATQKEFEMENSIAWLYF